LLLDGVCGDADRAICLIVIMAFAVFVLGIMCEGDHLRGRD